MVTKAISKLVNGSLWGGHLVIGTVLFLAVSSRKHPAQDLCWLSIMKKCIEILLTRLNGCANEDKANNSLVKSRNPTVPPSRQIYQSINQSINQSIFECIMPHGTRAQAGPKQHYTQTAHIFTRKKDC